MVHIIMMHAIVKEHIDNILIEVINRINIISREICQKKRLQDFDLHMRPQSHLLVKRASSVVPTFKKKKLPTCKLQVNQLTRRKLRFTEIHDLTLKITNFSSFNLFLEASTPLKIQQLKSFGKGK